MSGDLKKYQKSFEVKSSGGNKKRTKRVKEEIKKNKLTKHKRGGSSGHSI